MAWLLFRCVATLTAMAITYGLAYSLLGTEPGQRFLRFLHFTYEAEEAE